MDVRGAALAAGLALFGLGGPAWAACTFELKVELPVTMRGTRPITPVKINGADLDFEVDSGAFFSFINPSKAAELKLKPAYARGDAAGIGGSIQLQVVDADSFSVGGRTLRNYQFVVSPGFGDGVTGLIGQNLLIAGDVDYDLAGGKVRIMTPKGCGDAPLAYWAVGKPYSAIAVPPIRLDEPRTSAMVYINGKQVSAVLDTGASTSMLNLEAARRLGLSPEMAGARNAGFSTGIGPRLVRTWVVPVADFRIGDEEVKNTHLRIGDTSLRDHDMLLGADFFLSHHILVANSQRKLYFTYSGGPVFDLTTGAAAPTPPSAPSEPSSKPGLQ
jgi:predicted aspartyl protease